MGFLRLALAVFVVAQHLGGAKYLGSSAVQVFFILSGYLMTSIMVHSYGYSVNGFTKFWINRFLRLYPIYFLIIGVTIIVVTVLGSDATSNIVPVMYLPDTSWEWVQNLTMIFADLIPIQSEPRLSPPTWALTLELACYLLISLGVTRSTRVTCIWLILGASFLVFALFVSGSPQLWGYASIPSAFVPFAWGAMIFHMKSKISENSESLFSAYLGRLVSPSKAIAISLIAIFSISAIRAGVFVVTRSELFGMMIYILNLIPGTIAVVAALEWRGASDWTRRADKVAGDLAYPVYLSHWVVAVVIVSSLSRVTDLPWTRGPLLFLISIVPVILFSLALVFCLDRPINRLRDKVRPGPSLRMHEA